MKANAPDKIYIPTILVANTVRYKEEGSIEYIRKDAFIEKACVWIKENLLKHTYVCEGEVGIGMAVFLEEFKQAMKGE